MAELFFETGDTSTYGVPAPFLQGTYIMGIDFVERLDGFGESTPLGGGASARRHQDYGVSAEVESATDSAISQLTGIVSNIQTPNVAYNFTGLIGPQGPPGPPGPAGTPVVTSVAGGGGGAAQTDFGKPVVSSSIQWTDDGGGQISWTAGTVTIGTTVHNVAAGNTTLEFVYWDSASPTVFSTSASRGDVVGAGKWFIARNEGGAARPIYEGSKLWDANLLYDATVLANAIATDAITNVKIKNDAVTAPKIDVVGLDGSGRIVVTDATSANSVTDGVNTWATTLIQAGKIVIAGSTNLDNWSKTGDTTKIDGGQISTRTILAESIDSGEITANEIFANTITTNEIAFNTIANGNMATNSVDTPELVSESVTVQASAYTDGTVSIPSGTWTDMETVTITSVGSTLAIWCSFVLEDNSGSTNVEYKVTDSSTDVYNAVTAFSTSAYGIPVMFSFEDTPGSGSVTYRLQARGSGAASEGHHWSMIVREVQR